jgi:hypothetical protein
MAVRILHCSDNIENYNLCIRHKVAGFTHMGPKVGDTIYLAVKKGKKSFCGARFVLVKPTDHKPWPDAELYVNVLSAEELEVCEEFDLSDLSECGGPYWALKYVQGAKEIKDQNAIDLLASHFNSKALYRDENFLPLTVAEETPVESPSEIEIEDEEQLTQVEREIPDLRVQIMGTFQTIQFSSETDKIRGLERLVNENFFSLFPQFPVRNTLLIPENRLFKTKGYKVDERNVPGIRTIPDGLMIEFDEKLKSHFRINLIEYECYGERKQRDTEKSSYLNSTIIPQLMRFAASFSIITDEQTRSRTIKDWVDKIIEYVNAEPSQMEKFTSWIKTIKPDIQERSIEREMERKLIEAFSNSVRVLLIIDELSTEQRATIKNVVNSFKLVDGESAVQFSGHVVRLVQKINIRNNDSEYALTVQ